MTGWRIAWHRGGLRILRRNEHGTWGYVVKRRGRPRRYVYLLP